MPKSRFLAGGALVTVALVLGPVIASSQTYGGQRPMPPPNAAPQVPSGPQQFSPNPYLGMPEAGQGLPPSARWARQPPAATFSFIDPGTGQMRTCQRNGNVITCLRAPSGDGRNYVQTQ